MTPAQVFRSSAENAGVYARPPAPHDVLRLFELSNDLMVVLDREGSILHVNPAWTERLGWAAEELIGHSCLEFMHPDDVEAAHGRDHTAEGVYNYECRYRTRDGDWRRMLWSARADGEHWYAVAKDVTERAALEHRALHDPLTGLPNRLLFHDRLRQALARLPRHAGSVAVLFVDLDRFKSVNDSLGHAAGDALLVAVAERLSGLTRAGDTVARFGGDEFVLLAEDVADDGTTLAARVLATFAQPFELDGEIVACRASVGVVTTHDAGARPEDLCHRADLAMYRAKASGRACSRVFDEELATEVGERLAVEHELRHAVENGEMSVHFQPLVQIADGAVAACEALLRWRNPRFGDVGPGRFIPLAEDNGLIDELGAWVLEQACRQAGRWRREGRDVTVSVNVSPRQLTDRDFPDRVARTLHAAGLPAPALCLEVTETALTTGAHTLAPALEALRRAGVRIAIDDFGQGYASLSYLKVLPVDVIKLAGPFVDGLERTREDRGIVAAAMALAGELGLTVVAEGVERESTVRALRALGVKLAQGYYYARPAPAAALDFGVIRPDGQPGLGDPYMIRDFMRQIGIPARLR